MSCLPAQEAKALIATLPDALGPLKEALQHIEALKPPDFDSYAQWVTKHVALQKQMQSE
jgi:hypothetical protein